MKYLMLSKPLENLSYAELADTVADLGMDGVDLTVRSPGHVLPERVKADLPQAAQAIRSRGLEIGWLTTAIESADSPHAEDILATAADLGIKQFKLGYYRYAGFGEMRRQIAEVREQLHGIEALCQQYGIQAGVHAHDGPTLSATTHVVSLMLEGFDPAALCYYPDLGHIGIEGSFGGWIHGLDLLADRINMLALENLAQFQEVDSETGATHWRPKVVPFDQGFIPFPEAFTYLKQIGYAGYASFQAEYRGPNSFRDLDQAELLAQVRRDLQYTKRLADEVGL
ncbi:MAG: TIM barrel protein [Chloroflexi bacterium]|nr:TIM barrel protein [Chloroflexota bacterium]